MCNWVQVFAIPMGSAKQTERISSCFGGVEGSAEDSVLFGSFRFFPSPSAEGASLLILLFLRSRLVCGDLPDGLSAVVFPLLTSKTDSCYCLANAIFLKNSWNFITLW